MDNFTKNDIRILRSITSLNNKLKGNTKLSATSLKEIEDETGFSYQKIRSTILRFLELGYVAEGYPDGRRKTYMLTKKGYLFLDESIKNIREELNNE